GLSSDADVEGVVTSWDLSFRLNISIVSVTGSGQLVDTDATPLGFAFDNLSAGTCQVSGESVVSDNGSTWPSFGVGYGVGVQALGSSIAVPEPNGLALLGIALVCLAALRRRMAGKPAPQMTFNDLRTA